MESDEKMASAAADKKMSVADLASQKKSEISFTKPVGGLDFDLDVTLDDIIASYETTGLQATNVFRAIQEIKNMRRESARVYFGCTSNMISSGMREIIKFLAKNRHFDVLVTTGGGIEEDLIKCMLPTYIGAFDLDGEALRDNGWNRIGNMVINNTNYAVFEEWFNRIMDELIAGETVEYPNTRAVNGNRGYTAENPLILTPSKLINYLGKKINNESSVLYWCYKNGIRVYSPAVTDGSLGDLLTFYNQRAKFKLDIAEDIAGVNFECLGDQKNGAIILGSGLVKHHVFNANLFNDGLDFCVVINTAIEYDGSDSGATLGEAYSWGKVKGKKGVKVYGEASVVFPLIVYGAYKSKRE